MHYACSVRLASLLLVLAMAEFGETPDKIDKPKPAGAKEEALLAAVQVAAQWKPADPRVAKAYQNLAAFYASDGRYADAEKVYEKRLELVEDALGRANPDIIPAIHEVARVNFAQMKYARAEELFNRSLRIMEREYGDDDPKLVPAIDDVAKVFQADSKYADAEKCFRRAIAIREKTGGVENPELA